MIHSKSMHIKIINPMNYHRMEDEMWPLRGRQVLYLFSKHSLSNSGAEYLWTEQTNSGQCGIFT